MFIRGFLLFLLHISFFAINAQTPFVQTMRGTITDRSVKTILAGASIELLGKEKRAVVADEKGNFVLPDVPVGRQSLRITYVGFKPLLLTNLLVESGKQLVLNIELEEDVVAGKEVIVQSRLNRSRAINELAVVSTRMFSLEDIRRYAAGLNDPSRIATAFAGVTSQGDANNLIIRGNAPNGLLWRMEGVDIPNPNHFAKVGTSGGGISILSAQLLANSDFMISAFPAEYGNALSGVFDIKLRKGNHTRREHTFSISTIGIDAATEGYFKKGYAGSYLLNYRYGFLTLMQQLGLKIGEGATTFQDFSFHIHLPTKKLGTFTILGFGGNSRQVKEIAGDSVEWNRNPSSRNGWLDASKTGVLALTHSFLIGKKTFIKTILSANGYQYQEENSRRNTFRGPMIYTRDNEFLESNNILSVGVTHKFNSQQLLKFGIYTSSKSFNLWQRESVSNILRDRVKETGNTRLTNYYAQWRWSATRRLSLLAGIHGQHLNLNNTSVLEPRLGIKWVTGRQHVVSAGVGFHSQIQPLGNYFARIKVGTDSVQPNRGLGFSRAIHYVLGYTIPLGVDWQLKTEIYYQWLYDIPVSALVRNSFSMINQDDDFAITALNNRGCGKNYGVEITVERFFSNRFYLLSSVSLYDSRFLPSDKIWRSSRFNSNSLFTLVTGKEWNLKTSRPSVLTLDLKLFLSGGVRVTPIDLPRSITQKATVLDLTRIYAEKLNSIARLDLQMGWKIQKGKTTGSLIAGVQNLFNRKNPVSQSYDPVTQQIRYNYLLGLIPVVGYKVDF